MEVRYNIGDVIFKELRIILLNSSEQDSFNNLVVLEYVGKLEVFVKNVFQPEITTL